MPAEERTLPGDRATADEDARLEELADALGALANANRLRLLRWLTVPTTAGDLPLSPAEVRPGENPDRVMTRQGVRQHLKKLAKHGLVEVRREERPTGPVDAFVIHHQRVYALLEELRRVAAVSPEVRVDAMTTMDAPRRAERQRATGPRVLVVKGRDEGRTIPLVRADEAGWVIGRRPDCAISLDYDPYVSATHCEVVPQGGGTFSLLDLRTSKNGTLLNFERLERGAEAPLGHGDLIGVGASLLLFQTE